MKHRLANRLTLLGLFTGSLLMLTTIEAQGSNGTSQCREDAPKIMSACTKDLESLKDQSADMPCLYKVELYMCNAAYLCKNCTEAEVSELTANLRQEAKESLAGNGNCSDFKAPDDLEKLNCQRVLDLYFPGDDNTALIGSIVFFILICCIGVAVYFFACKGKGKAKSKSKSNSSKRKTGKRGKSSTGRGKSSTGQGKSSTGAGKSSTGQGKSSTRAGGKSTTGADSSNTAPPDGSKSATGAPAEAK